MSDSDTYILWRHHDAIVIENARNVVCCLIFCLFLKRQGIVLSEHVSKTSIYWLFHCFFKFRPIASKLLNSLNTIDTLSWLGGAVETHPLWVQEVPGSIPGSGKSFMFDFLYCCCCVFSFCPKTYYLSLKFEIPFAMLIYLVHFTYCKICD